VTLFAAILAGLGLSQSEAAAYLDVRTDTVKSWSAGRNRVPDGVWDKLHALAERQETVATGVYEAWREAGMPDEFEISNSSPEWTSEGAWMAVLRRAWEMMGPDVAIRPVAPGSTEAVRAAARARKFSDPS
jgi:hypothetical protein